MSFGFQPMSQCAFCLQCRYWKRARNAECESERYNLYKHWARFLCFYKEQPLNLIRQAQMIWIQMYRFITNADTEMSELIVSFVLLFQEILWGKDRDLLRLAGLLHWNAVLCCCHGPHLFCLRSAQLWWQHIKVSPTRGSQSHKLPLRVLLAFQICHVRQKSLTLPLKWPSTSFNHLLS